MLGAFARFGLSAKSSAQRITSLSSFTARWQSTKRETCFGDIFDSDPLTGKQPQPAPSQNTPGSGDDNVYLQEVLERAHHVKTCNNMPSTYKPAYYMQALQHVDIDAALEQFLLRPQREIHVELVITMDNGEVESFNAYRVQHNNFRGPYKGGYRLAPDVDMQEMRR